MVTIHARGPVPAEEAWDRYARPARWSSWSPQIMGVTCTAGRLDVGVSGRVHGPLGVSVDFRVDAWDDVTRRWTWTARRGPLRVRLDHGVDADGPGSATWVRIHTWLPIALAYAPLVKLALHRLVTASLEA